jgi:hypothetical protein
VQGGERAVVAGGIQEEKRTGGKRGIGGTREGMIGNGTEGTTGEGTTEVDIETMTRGGEEVIERISGGIGRIIGGTTIGIEKGKLIAIEGGRPIEEEGITRGGGRSTSRINTASHIGTWTRKKIDGCPTYAPLTSCR